MYRYKVINGKAGIRTTIETSLDIEEEIPYTSLTQHGVNYTNAKRTKVLQKEVARILGMDALPPRTTIKRATR